MRIVPFASPDIGAGEIDAVVECLRSGWLTSGRKVELFEQAFADAVGAEHAIAVSSATMGALLILDALGIGAGDEVIVPAYTFSGPAMMAHRLGARVVLADCRRGDPMMSGSEVEKLITDRTRVVMPTHFGGAAYESSSLGPLCEERGIHIVHDAAHAFPTRYSDGSPVGSSGKASFFSFYATKTLTTGEGGMVVTNDGELARRVRKLRIHGFDRTIFDRYSNTRTGWRYDIALPGWKANMTDIAAAIGLVQLERSKEMLARRQTIALRYDRLLARQTRVTRPVGVTGHAWHLYPVRVPDRDVFIAGMAKRGVQCSVHFIPLHHHTAWRRIGVRDCPCASEVFEHAASLPIYSSMTDDEVEQVVAAMRDTLEEPPSAAGIE